MSSTAPQASSVSRRAIVLANQPDAALSALGASFDDLVLGSLNDVASELVGAGPETVVVVAGAVPDSVVDAVVQHLVAVPGARLALSVSAESDSVRADQLLGLRILGDSCLGDLPVTWWAASDADADLRPQSGGPGGLTRPGDEASFVAHARLLRAQRELAPTTGERPGRPSAPDLSLDPAGPSLAVSPGPASRDPLEASPVSRTNHSRTVLLGYRLPLVAVLVLLGAALGVLAGELVDGDEVVWALLIVALATAALALAWVVRTLRTLSAEIRELSVRTGRLRGDIDRGLGRLARRVSTEADRGARSAAKIRQIESRLAVVSTASPNLERTLARAKGSAGNADDRDR